MQPPYNEWDEAPYLAKGSCRFGKNAMGYGKMLKVDTGNVRQVFPLA